MAEEPLQADEWLNTIEQKFHLLRVTELLKAEYASHQLQGPAGIWWAHFLSSLSANARVTWEQFKLAFRGHHIPLGLMHMKTAEFMRLTQGMKTLTEYMHAFNNLSRYALGFVDTKEKKILRPVVVLDRLPSLYGLKYDSVTTCVLLLYLCSYKLDGSATAGIRARFSINCHMCI